MLVGLVAGGLVRAVGYRELADIVWAISTAVVLVPAIISTGRGLWRRQASVDVIAVLAMGGALTLGEYLAGAIIAVMLTGGAALEQFAAARARRELTALLQRAPRTAHRRVGEDLVTVNVEAIEVGDRLVVKPGEVVPADGILAIDGALVDQSALTGESKPVDLTQGAIVQSGVTNVGNPLEIQVTARAEESTYAAIVRLVKAAESSKAPFVRLADRFALGFLGVTLVLAAAAWALSGDSIRALAVLVVATPCPLILAAPAAIISGVSHAARHGIIIKGGGPLESLAKTTVFLFDKTGTLTAGRSRVVAVESIGSLSSDTLVQLAASVEQVSVHPFAPSIIAAAQGRNLSLSFPAQVHEQMGAGISGVVDGRRVAVGQLRWVSPEAPRSAALRSVELRVAVEGSSSVYIAVDGQLEGALILHDPIRAEAPRALRSLRKAGVRYIHMVTGDHPDVAELVGDAVGVDRVFAERTPEEKVDVVELVRPDGITTMVGDGVNDAPALALADVGVAMGARGATAASEAADVVLTADRLEGLVLASRIARRTRKIALQSVIAGMGLSVVAMVAAAFGKITPVAGAILQEVIDVVVILNALRALAGGNVVPATNEASRALARQLAHAHRSLRPQVEELAALAARLEQLPPPAAREQLERVLTILEQEILPHEREEQETAYPLIRKILREEDPTGPLVQTHHEIHRLSRLYGRMLDRLPPEGPGREDLRDLQRVLYGLHAILSLHFSQEEELYSMLEA